MDKSESIKELAAALAKAQAKIEGAKKEATNPHFRTAYADLNSVWEAVRGPLSENGLSVVQLPSTTDRGISVTTVLMHDSGEWISDVLTLPLEKPTPQAAGSAITYARRYSLMAVAGVAPDDDDGNDAESHQKNQPPRRTAQNRPAAQSRPAPAPKPAAKPASPKSIAITTVSDWSGVDTPDVPNAVRDACRAAGIDTSKPLTDSQWDKLTAWASDKMSANLTFSECTATVPQTEKVAA